MPRPVQTCISTTFVNKLAHHAIIQPKNHTNKQTKNRPIRQSHTAQSANHAINLPHIQQLEICWDCAGQVQNGKTDPPKNKNQPSTQPGHHTITSNTINHAHATTPPQNPPHKHPPHNHKQHHLTHYDDLPYAAPQYHTLSGSNGTTNIYPTIRHYITW